MADTQRRGPGDGPLRQSDGVWSSGVQDRAVLYSSTHGKAIVLNSTGAALWEALDSPRTPQQLADLLLHRFPDLDAGQALADVRAFLDRLLGESVLQSAP